MANVDFEKEKIADGYIAPEGYFDQLEERVMRRISIEKEKRKKRISLLRWVGAAAACAVAATLFFFAFPPEKSREDTLLATQTTETVEEVFHEMDNIETTLTAFHNPTEEEDLQIAREMENNVSAVEAMIESGNMRDEDYQMLDCYVEDALCDLYY